MLKLYPFRAPALPLLRSCIGLLGLLLWGPAALAQPTSYCTANLGAWCGAGNANINLVAIPGTPLNNPNTTCNTVNGSGYTLWPASGSTTATLLRGLSYPVSVMTPEAGIISVWVDWNQNGLFEASEWTQVTTASTAGQAASATITVPATAVLGPTGLRVRSRLSGNPNAAGDACLTMGSGETEDYIVTIGGAPACAPPTALNVSSIGTTTATLTFSGASNGTAVGYTVQYGPAGFTPGGMGSTSVASTSTSVPVTGLNANTAYQFYVSKDCGGGQLSQLAGPFTFRTACVPPTYASLPVSESFETAWASVCDTRDAPSTFWRTAPFTGNSSWRRDDDGASAGWTSPTVGVYAPTGSQGSRSARFHSYYAAANDVGALDLYVDLSGALNKLLRFDYLNTAGNDSLLVQVSTNGGATFGAPLLRLGLSGTVTQGWQPSNVSITSASATTVIRFLGKVTGTFTSDIGLDNVRLEVLTGIPSCATNLSPANGSTGVQRPVTLTWQNGTGGIATGYDVYFGSSATSLTLVSSNQPGTSYAIATSLAGNTTYYYQVVSRNANGAATGCPVQSFTTNNVFAYCNSNLGAYCGTGNANISGVAITNTTLNNPNTTCNTVNGSGYTLWPAAGNTTAALSPGVSYQVSVTTAEAGIISVWFDWNQNGQFEASEWTQVTTASTANQPASVNIMVPASALPGQTGMRVRSRLSGNPNAAGDACALMGSGETEDYIITVGPPPACAPPINLAVTNVSTTTATLTFSGATNGTAVGYTVQYGPAGFMPGGANSTTVNTSSTTVPVTGLLPNTAYQFYVTKDCGAGQSSFPNGPFSFRTLCLAPVYASLPVIQSFENAWTNGCDTRDIPNTSWRNSPATGNNSWRRDDDGTAGAWVGPALGMYTPAASQGARSARFHTYNVPRGNEGMLDLFVNLGMPGPKRLSFDFINTTGTDSLYVELSDNSGGTYTRLARLGLSGTSGFSSQVVNINSTSATAVLRFRAKGDFGVTDIGLDNLVLESATGCLTPAQLSATTTTTAASLSWLTGGTGTYTVEYGPTGFTPGTGTAVSGLTAPPYALTGLTPGTTYQFYVTLNCAGGNSGTAGPASFTTQIVNDEPCGATVLTLNNTCVPTATTTFGATATSSIPAGTCANFPTTAPLDVWFRFTTAASGPTSTSVRISVNGAPANTVRAYSAASCNGPFAFLACSSAANGTTAAPNLDLTGLMPNTTYYVRVGSYSTTSALGNFTICASPVPNCPDPAGPAAGSLTNSTAQLSWNASPASGSTFTVVYGPTGFNPATGGTTVTGITGNGTTLTGLMANSTYQFYVQQICGGFNGSSTLVGPVSFTTPLTAPSNDEPCGALPLMNGTLNASNVGATTTQAAGITLPACSPSAAPKDVWFIMTPAGSSTTLTLTGNPAGMVRVYSAATCSGPFAMVACQSSGSNNTGFSSPISLMGLTPGQRYYVAVSGFGSSDTNGAFSLAATNLLATRAQAETTALVVYPNPSSSGQLTLRLEAAPAAGQAVLVNALGQQVRALALPAGVLEHTLSTRGLAAGIYTLHVQRGSELLSRKVVIE
ncbi:hypothetical protein GCM10023185_19810 [Hymenobacter saemangeumensis]|uniref:T9SS type A sorting domain-containing protein n=1 Tax=Hymenobacter saemangeumensis TaxID=1084522 RepID=A0ABP8IDC9_9BACT